MHQLLLILHLLICLTLIGLVLVQHGKGADAGAMMGGSAHSVFGSQGSTSFLVKITTFLAMAFFVTSLVLGLFAPGKLGRHQSLTTQVLEQPVPSAPDTADSKK